MFGFVPTAQNIFICLRCQYKLAIRNRNVPRHPKSLQLPLSPRRAITTGRALQQNQSQALEGQHRISLDEDSIGERAKLHSTPHQYNTQPANIRHVQHGLEKGLRGQDSREKSPSRRRGSSKQDTTTRHVDEGETFTLDINALGKSAQIRLLRLSQEKPDRARKNVPFTTEKVRAKKIVDSADLVKTMAAETGIIRQAAVNENIEQLRQTLLPSNDAAGFPTLSECQGIFQQLYAGFTHPQLSRYRTICPTLTDSFDLKGEFHAKDFARSAWSVGSSSFPDKALERLNSAIRKFDENLIRPLDGGKTIRSKKQHVIQAILRQDWNIRTREEVLLEGELDMQLKKEYLDLLLNHSKLYYSSPPDLKLTEIIDRKLFDNLAQQYNAKIDISRSHRLIRITADFVTCQELFKKLHNTFSNIRCDDLDIPSSDQLTTSARGMLNDERSIDHLCRLTSTLIIPIRSEDQEKVQNKVHDLGKEMYGMWLTTCQLRIYYLGPDATGLEDVRRLFSQLTEPDPARDGQVFCGIRGTSVPVQAPIDVGSTLPWAERATQWTRWRCGLNRKPIVEKEMQAYPDGEQDIKTSIAHCLFDQSQHQPITAQSPQPSEYWQTHQTHVLTATIGPIAYPNPTYDSLKTVHSNARQERRAQLAFRKDIESRRVMVSEFPGILETLEVFSQQPIITQELHVRLSPIASSESPFTQRLPDIEICIEIDKSIRRPRLISAQLIVQERVSDLLLPDQAYDVRFHDRSHFAAPYMRFDDRITQFVEASNFDVWGTDRLRTPSRLNISIPKTALRAPIKTTSANVESNSGGFVEAEYTFVYLEHRSSMHLEYRGIPTRYTTVEGGQSRGRRSECSLLMPVYPRLKGGDGHKPTRAENFARFFDKVLDTVNRVKYPEKDVLKSSSQNHTFADSGPTMRTRPLLSAGEVIYQHTSEQGLRKLKR